MPKPHKIRIMSDDEEQATQAAAESGAKAAGETEQAAESAPARSAAAQQRAAEFSLEERVAEAERRADEINEKYLRALADLENYRRRARQEKQEAVRAGEAAILTEVLPAIDNFTRAMDAAQESNDVQALIKGVRMIHDQLLDALARKGVRPIPAEGEAFDPAYHDAVGKVETTEQPEGTVTVEIQKGYMLGDRVLRPSRVMVAVRPAGDAASEDSAREES
jgi:molecular chaperone GrpE